MRSLRLALFNQRHENLSDCGPDERSDAGHAIEERTPELVIGGIVQKRDHMRQKNIMGPLLAEEDAETSSTLKMKVIDSASRSEMSEKAAAFLCRFDFFFCGNRCGGRVLTFFQ